MRLKTFTAKTMQEAMAEVRATLGHDAIIVSSHAGGKGSLVRVVAAIDREPPAVRQVNTSPEPVIGDKIDAYAVDEALSHHRVPAMLRDTLIRLAQSVEAESPTLQLAAAFDARLRFAPLTEGDGRPLVIVGPPGGGKTVTAARLAAEAMLNDETVALITTDVVRAGGAEQLRHYGKLAGLEVTVAQSADHLRRDAQAALARGCQRVLVDTAGVNPYDAAEMEALKSLLTMLDAEAALVLPAGMDSEEAHDIAILFADAGCRRLITTRLDVSRRFGGIIAAAAAGPLTIAGLAASPFIGERLESVNPVSLARAFTARADNQSSTKKQRVTS
ncbi:MAG: hypothetical protein H3C28_08625 [Sphingomonadales bacterium]|nr:hypothetical protein [Sphingomonadales bacterium]